MTIDRRDRFLVFVSHATRDSALAIRLSGILDSLGLPAFVYETYRVGGQNRFDVIRNRISECPYFVLLLTRRARRSEWVNQETGFAAAMGKEIIPLVEVSSVRGRRIPYFGFAELSDPLDLSPDQPASAIGELLRTIMQYARRDRYWSGLLQLKCGCGWAGRRGVRNLTQWEWDCPRCEEKISHSPVTFEPLPQEP